MLLEANWFSSLRLYLYLAELIALRTAYLAWLRDAVARNRAFPIARVTLHISFAVAKTIATALLRRRLDYCNSIYHTIPLKDMLKLQRVKNCLARVVTRSPRFSHS